MSVKEMTPQELKRRMDIGEPTHVIDVREPWEVAIARIQGAENLPMAQVPAQAVNLPRDRDLVLMCKSGGRSLRAAQYLAAQGFERVYNLKGGIDAWAQEVDPGLPTY